MRSLARPSLEWTVLAILVVILMGCQTLEYRQVQRDFEAAVRADNEGSVFTDLHQGIVAQLTPEYIASLDERLRPNAWLLRAVSAWRSGDFAVARASAQRGLSEPKLVAHSRDDVLMSMIDALVVDSDVRQRWLAADRVATAETYSGYERDFKVALEQLAKAGAKISAPTPDSVQAYYHYQRWRILQNWSQVISRIDPKTPDVMLSALDRATAHLGQTPQKAAEVERDMLPADHPLRALIRTQGGG
jgi:hypothetical protein